MSEAVLSDERVGRRVILGGAQRTVGFFVSSLLTAGSAVVLLRYLKPASFGRYGTILALVGIVYGISEMGLTATGTRELALASTREDRRRLLPEIVGLRIVVTSLGVLAAIAFALLAGYADALVIGTALAGVGVLLQSVQAAMLMPLSVQLHNGALALNQVLMQVALLAGFGLLAAIGAGLIPFFAVQILVGVVLLALVPVLVSRDYLVLPRVTVEGIKSVGRLALPVAVATVLGVLFLRILVITMSLLSARPVQLGYFVTSTRVLELVGGVPFLVMSIVLPVVSVAARQDHDRLVYITGRVAQMMVLAGVLVALLLWTLATPVVTLLGGSRYRAAGPVLEIQGFATVAIFLTAAWQPALMGMFRLRSLIAAMSAGLFAVVLAGVILIPPYQATGAAVAAVIGEVTLCAAVYVAIRRAGPGEWLPLRPTLRVAAAGALAAVVGLIPWLPAIPRAVLVGGVFVVAAIVLDAVPSELSDGFRSALTRLPLHSRAASEGQ